MFLALYLLTMSKQAFSIYGWIGSTHLLVNLIKPLGYVINVGVISWWI